MCGICGLVDFNNTVDDSIVKTMMESIKHRGPDGEGVFIDKHVSLGHVRLSIIDLSAEAIQPMHSEDENLVIVFNGEIYNYLDIKNELLSKYTFKTKSDTEVIINAYKEWGEDCLHKLNGMFSFVIYNKNAQTLFAARDRFGIKPFYYYNGGDNFVFGSEIKAIFKSGKIKPEPNDNMLYDFIIFNRTDHTNETCFKDIYNLRPGHKLNIDINNKKIKIDQWYFLPQVKTITSNYEYCKDTLFKRLEKSIDLHMVSDVPVGSALSGGLDSSTIVALMRKLIPPQKTLHTFSAVYDKSWEKDESIYIEALKGELDIETNYIYPMAERLLKDVDKLIYHQEEPFASASLFASWCLYDSVNRRGVKVLLNGQGADELFGYDYMAAFYFKELLIDFKWLTLLKELSFFYKKQAFGVKFTFSLFGFLLIPKFLRNRAIGHSNNIVNKNFFDRYKGKSDFLIAFFDSKSLNDNVKNHLLFKLNHLLRIEDKNSMTFSVEARVPFLEHELVEFALNVPSKFKIHNGELKYILKQTMKSLLPSIIYNRNNKIGYETPMDNWFRTTEFISYIDSLLTNKIQPVEKYLNISFVKLKWDKHKSGAENNAEIIWKYVYLTRWYKLYFG